MLEGDPNDPTTWTRSPNNNLGLGRRIEANWDVDKLPRGWFVSDQFGRIMDNIDDPRCGQTVTAHGQQHVVKCLWQYISDTVQPLSFPGNSMQKDFPGRDIVELPN